LSLPLWSIIVAAGASRRAPGETPKQYRPLAGRPLLLHALTTFARHGDGERIVLVVPPGDEARAAELVARHLPAPPRVVGGGATRQESVRRGLAAIPDADGLVAVHDAARPFFNGAQLPLWRLRLEAMGEDAALVPALAVPDTVLRLEDERVAETLDRGGLARAQTPQLFRLGLLRRAHEAALQRGETDASDDGSLVLALGKSLAAAPGDPGNFKITTAADFERAAGLLADRTRAAGSRRGSDAIRSGLGYDSHRFDPERPLILGGVEIPSADGGLAGHSDADVAAHALMDALLGAAALGDIGRHFPDDDPAHAGADSMQLLAQVCALVAERGWRPSNVDLTIIAERPRLAPHIDAMRARLAQVLGIDVARVSVKATSNEGMGAIGRGEGIAALALAALERNE
jgi:2-C-methyl-D-erythritol 4-phosphate cytidylyltransferase/2-C-methyl-D-erythritol 2,4-cyclodiphosphate synthase